MSYKHLLVAVDLSAPSDTMISKAVSMAKNLDAKISFIYVDITHQDADLLDYDPAEVNQIQRDHDDLMQQLNEITGLIRYPIENKLVVTGDVEEQLNEAVKEISADLLVSGHHHGFWNRWWSSARKLVSMADVDLLLIRI
ncbi:universal stress protein [Vibrio sp. HA2012]|uniref:universal stress protein n=1 Tax=Vibrio sp. HA2012 TaxID=1971595 RepID=UPI000C2C5AE9|nr:universal stress protein [Vibrio sp. HA2012]PJC87598.1 universal stress protein [Vibrio sp. HA2012]